MHHEERLYCPPRPPPGVRWTTVFRNDLWPLRNMWRATATATVEADAPVDTNAATTNAASALALNTWPGTSVLGPGDGDPATADFPTAQQISDAYEVRMAAEAGGASGSGIGAESRYSMNVAVRFRLVFLVAKMELSFNCKILLINISHQLHQPHRTH